MFNVVTENNHNAEISLPIIEEINEDVLKEDVL